MLPSILMDGAKALVSLWCGWRFAPMLTKSSVGITLFPPNDCCSSEMCIGRNKELKTMESHKVIIYTINGASPGHSIHIICVCE